MEKKSKAIQNRNIYFRIRSFSVYTVTGILVSCIIIYLSWHKLFWNKYYDFKLLKKWRTDFSLRFDISHRISKSRNKRGLNVKKDWRKNKTGEEEEEKEIREEEKKETREKG